MTTVDRCSSLDLLFGLVCGLILLMSLPAFSQAAQLSAERGVVVEQVTKGSEAEKAGFKADDVILSWSRSDSGGNIESPFDLTEVELEQKPRGSVLLEGLRGQEKQTWTMGLTAWGIVVRPPLSAELLAAYQQDQELTKTGAWSEAAVLLRTAASRVPKSDPAWLSPWLLSRVAEWQARAKQWKEADEAYGEASELAPSAGTKVMVQLLRAWGRLFQTRSEWAKAEECYNRSITESRKLAVTSLTLAGALNDLGNVAINRGDLAEAEVYYRQALAICEKLAPGSLDAAGFLSNLGGVAISRGDLAKAEVYYRQALATQEDLAPGSLDVARSLGSLGVVANNRGDLAKAEEYYRRGLAIREKLAPGSLDVARSLGHLGAVARNRGDPVKAEEYYRQALATQEKLAPGSLANAETLSNLGNLANYRGDLAKAEEYSRQALAIQEKLAPGSLNVARTLGDLGAVAGNRGDLAKAEEYYRQALAVDEKLAPGSLDVAAILAELGNVASDRGDLAKAEEYYRQALATREKLAPGSLVVAMSLNNLGAVASRRGDLGKAEEYYGQALAIQKKLAPDSLDVAETLGNVGNVARDRGDLGRAEEYFRQALAILEKLAPGSSSEAETLYDLAAILFRQGQADRAITLFERAVTTLETQMSHLGGTEEVRSGFRAQRSSYYRDYLGALLAQRQPERAFYVLERSRARSLLSMLAERDLVFAADLPAEIQRERKFNAADYDRTQAQIARLNPTKDAAQIEQSLIRLRELATEREQITERIKRTSPRFAALQYPQPLDLQGTREVLDTGTALLSYSVGAEQTVLFVVQPNGVTPGFSVYTLAVAEESLRSQIEEFRHLIGEHSATNRAALDQHARALYDLLVKPAEAELASSERLLIAPDGPLHTLPFAALLRDEKQYLIEWKPLHTIVSATLYAELKKTRDERRSPPLQLAAFGDPLYPKLGQQSGDRAANPDLRSAVERGLDLARLPFTRDEVNGIAALFPKRSQTYLGAEATEERAKSVSAQARYVHFATHAFLDERFPLNSGLALTIPEKATDGQENGLLQAWEIFEQVRLDADLVVLSACQTGMGKELSGEGLIGLTRAFQYAGARSIVASLWNVDDLKTAQLMKSFYAAMQNGKSKDEALRAALLELLHSRSGAHPYYWAAFSLIGDWR
jgi:CHAT domain-containing protein/tetratricopeptide (TPR) repeat protein